MNFNLFKWSKAEWSDAIENGAVFPLASLVGYVASSRLGWPVAFVAALGFVVAWHSFFHWRRKLKAG